MAAAGGGPAYTDTSLRSVARVASLPAESKIHDIVKRLGEVAKINFQIRQAEDKAIRSRLAREMRKKAEGLRNVAIVGKCPVQAFVNSDGTIDIEAEEMVEPSRAVGYLMDYYADSKIANNKNGKAFLANFTGAKLPDACRLDRKLFFRAPNPIAIADDSDPLANAFALCQPASCISSLVIKEKNNQDSINLAEALETRITNDLKRRGVNPSTEYITTSTPSSIQDLINDGPNVSKTISEFKREISQKYRRLYKIRNSKDAPDGEVTKVADDVVSCYVKFLKTDGTSSKSPAGRCNKINNCTFIKTSSGDPNLGICIPEVPFKKGHPGEEPLLGTKAKGMGSRIASDIGKLTRGIASVGEAAAKKEISKDNPADGTGLFMFGGGRQLEGAGESKGSEDPTSDLEGEDEDEREANIMVAGGGRADMSANTKDIRDAFSWFWSS